MAYKKEITNAKIEKLNNNLEKLRSKWRNIPNGKERWLINGKIDKLKERIEKAKELEEKKQRNLKIKKVISNLNKKFGIINKRIRVIKKDISPNCSAAGKELKEKKTSKAGRQLAGCLHYESSYGKIDTNRKREIKYKNIKSNANGLIWQIGIGRDGEEKNLNLIHKRSRTTILQVLPNYDKISASTYIKEIDPLAKKLNWNISKDEIKNNPEYLELYKKINKYVQDKLK